MHWGNCCINLLPDYSCQRLQGDTITTDGFCIPRWACWNKFLIFFVQQWCMWRVYSISCSAISFPAGTPLGASGIGAKKWTRTQHRVRRTEYLSRICFMWYFAGILFSKAFVPQIACRRKTVHMFHFYFKGVCPKNFFDKFVGGTLSFGDAISSFLFLYECSSNMSPMKRIASTMCATSRKAITPLPPPPHE